MKRWLNNWFLRLLLLVFISFYFFACFIDYKNQNINNYNSSLQLTTRYSLDQMREFAFENALLFSYRLKNLSFIYLLKNKKKRFNIKKKDVIIFIHIQKTAGTTFEKFLVNHLNISPCVCFNKSKICDCFKRTKKIWLFSRYSTGWACGLHADFTELYVSGCVEKFIDQKEGKHKKRRYFYTTFLRDPVQRFISEFSHVTRGASWKKSFHLCNGKPPTANELPMCFDPKSGWKGVDLNEFLSCSFNLAFNRQTRMLADLTLVNCYDTASMDKAKRESIMLKSAKNTLINLPFFGIKERMNDSQLLFEKIFNLKFKKNLKNWNVSKSDSIHPSIEQLKIIEELNALDIELYKFALELFDQRLAFIKNDNFINVSSLII